MTVTADDKFDQNFLICSHRQSMILMEVFKAGITKIGQHAVYLHGRTFVQPGPA